MRFILTSILITLLAMPSEAQISETSLLGYWLVEKVQVGPRNMTPDAKWICFKSGRSFIGGNGYLRNSAGRYSFDSTGAALQLFDSLSLQDPNGAFQLDYAADRMEWKRIEEGQEVKVFLKRIEELPTAMADQLKGLWLQEGAFSLYLSWDRSYRKFLEDGSVEHGVWRNHPHRPELVLIPWDKKKTSQFYRIEKSSFDQLQLTDLEREKTMNFERSRKFPTN